MITETASSVTMPKPKRCRTVLRTGCIHPPFLGFFLAPFF
jgi:hypothetical protein